MPALRAQPGSKAKQVPPALRALKVRLALSDLHPIPVAAFISCAPCALRPAASRNAKQTKSSSQLGAVPPETKRIFRLKGPRLAAAVEDRVTTLFLPSALNRQRPNG
jgi:hypothetical protein